jgi:ubiquinone/menaquinone biosynthesis C-methylase UbiE
MTTTVNHALPDHEPHCCPWWLGWLLASPLRRLLEDPDALLGPLVEPGQRVLEIGPGYGFFTTALAARVGTHGRVFAVDVQRAMLDGLERRLRRRGLDARVETRCCTPSDLPLRDLAGTLDLAVLIHVLHEMDDPRGALTAVADSLKPGGRLLLIEPKGHVKPALYESELGILRGLGLLPTTPPSAQLARHALTSLWTRP